MLHARCVLLGPIMHSTNSYNYGDLQFENVIADNNQFQGLFPRVFSSLIF